MSNVSAMKPFSLSNALGQNEQTYLSLTSSSAWSNIYGQSQKGIHRLGQLWPYWQTLSQPKTLASGNSSLSFFCNQSQKKKFLCSVTEAKIMKLLWPLFTNGLNKLQCFYVAGFSRVGLSLGSIFIKLYNLRMDPISCSVCFWQVFPAWCNVTLSYWAQLYFTKKMKCCEFGPWSYLQTFGQAVKDLPGTSTPAFLANL